MTVLHISKLAVAALMLIGSGLQAATYKTVVPEKSRIAFSYRQMGVNMDGQFKKFSAQVALDTARLEKASGRIDIDLASVDTGSSEADQEVVGKAWFHVAAQPRASFVLQQIRGTAAAQEAVGLLTLKGQTRELRAPLKLSPQGLLSGSLVIRRADFGIGEGMWSKFDVVANEITVHFSLQLQ